MQSDYAVIQVKETFTSTYIIDIDKKILSDVIDQFETGTHEEVPTTSNLGESEVIRFRLVDQDVAYALSQSDYEEMADYFKSSK